MGARFAIEALSRAHQRKTLSCGNEWINRHFHETVTQDVKRRYATCFVARDLETGQIAGFYTLSSSNAPLMGVPEPLASRLPRYRTVLISWLGRDQSYAGLGLGEALLFDAIRTVAEAPIGAHAMFADAIDGKAAAFCAEFGSIALSDRPNTLYLPVATAERLLSGETSWSVSPCHYAPPCTCGFLLRGWGGVGRCHCRRGFGLPGDRRRVRYCSYAQGGSDGRVIFHCASAGVAPEAPGQDR